MTITRDDLDLDGNDQEEQEQDGEGIAKKEADERLAASEKARQEAEIARARAEGEAEAMRRGIKNEAPPAAAALTDAQWQELEVQHGKTRQQIMADAQLTRATAEEAVRPLKAALEEARKEAQEAKEEAKRARSGTSLYAVEKDFYDKNPGLSAHKGDISDFINKFPEEMRSDPKKYKEILDDARVYVRGKVREDRNSNKSRSRDDREDSRRNYNTDRVEFDNDDRRDDDDAKLDLSDIDNEGSRRLIENIARRPGGEDLMDAPLAIDEMPIAQAYKASERPDGRGVSIDERGEFLRGRRQSEKSLRDTRPLRMSEDERDRRDRRR